MRLWHKDLIPVLPDKQLLDQWRECCVIAKNIAAKGTPNHLLVNKIMDYPLEHFLRYGEFVQHEMCIRGFKVNLGKFIQFLEMTNCNFFNVVSTHELFNDWHNKRYMSQCFMNLQEKFDCGGIKAEDYDKICEFYWNYITNAKLIKAPEVEG